MNKLYWNYFLSKHTFSTYKKGSQQDLWMTQRKWDIILERHVTAEFCIECNSGELPLYFVGCEKLSEK